MRKSDKGLGISPSKSSTASSCVLLRFLKLEDSDPDIDHCEGCEWAVPSISASKSGVSVTCIFAEFVLSNGVVRPGPEGIVSQLSQDIDVLGEGVGSKAGICPCTGAMVQFVNALRSA
jgi:hypothetical protein